MSDTQTEATEAPPPTETDTPTYSEPVDDASAPDTAPTDERPNGLPFGHFAVGGLSAAAVTLGGLYHLAGVPGLIGGAAVAGTGAVAYVQRRRKAKTGGSWSMAGGSRPPGSKSSSVRSRVGGLFAGRDGRRAAVAGTASRMTAGGSTSRPRRADRGRTGGLGGSRQTYTAGAQNRRGGQRQRGPISAAAHKAGGVGRRIRGLASRARQVGDQIDQAVMRGTRRAVGWADRKTGGRAGRACRFADKQTRQAAAWVDRRTGRRISTWLAARRRKTPTTAPAAAPDDGEQPLRGDADCPRCGTRHKAVIPAEEQDITIVCPCGHRITFYRAPNDPPEETTEMPHKRRRHPYTANTNNRRNRTMTAFPLAAAAAEVNAAAASHAPADMFQVARELDLLAEVPANVGMALRTYTQRLQGEYPIDQAVVEALGQLYAAHGQLVQMAEEIGPLFRQVHAEDLKREEAPRTNEQAWNV